MSAARAGVVVTTNLNVAATMANSGSTTALVRQARQGDQQAANRLLASNRDRLRRMVNARMDTRLAARLDASDIVQEALMEANRRLPDFLKKNDDLFYPWLRAIAWERLIQSHRQHIGAQKRTVQREAIGGLQLPDASATELSRQIAVSISTPSVAAARKELQQRVRQHLEGMRPADKEILLLRHLEQLPMNEVAAVIGISLGAAQSRYCRALERMHDLIGDSSL